MVAELYGRHQNRLDRLLSVYGGDADIVRSVNTGTEFDPVWVDTEYPVTFLETGYTREERGGDLVPVSGIAGHIKVDASIVPVISDNLKVSGVTYSITSIVGVHPSPDGLTILYIVRGAV